MASVFRRDKALKPAVLIPTQPGEAAHLIAREFFEPPATNGGLLLRILHQYKLRRGP